MRLHSRTPHHLPLAVALIAIVSLLAVPAAQALS